jgi:predicted RNA-binding protein Jag
MSKQSLDIFGEFLVKNLRDNGIENAETLLNNKSKAPSNLKIQTEISKFNESKKELIKEIVIKSIDTAIHNFLFSLQELADFENNIQISVNGENIVELSDGIHGESYSEDGWNAKFSKYESKE